MKTLLLVIALAAHAEAPKTGLGPATAATAAVAAVATLPEVPFVHATRHGWIEVFPSPADATGCSLSDLLRTRFLSGPWSAARRLEAARLRGNAEEARRMERTLNDLIDEAAASDVP